MKLAPRQVDLSATPRYREPCGVQAQLAMVDDAVHPPDIAPMQGANTRQQFGGIEWLAHEIVCTQIECLNPVGHVITRSQHQDRHIDRKSVVEGKSVSVRVDLGGRRIIKKKKKKN